MLELLPQDETIHITKSEPTDTINFLSSYIENNFCENMSVDISLMNILDACYVSTVCSAKHYIKYPNGKIKWKISSELVSEFNSNLELGNSEYTL